MKDTLQIAAYRQQASGNVHAMFNAWVTEAVKHSLIQMQDETIKHHDHAKEGWDLAGARLNKIRELEHIIARKEADEHYAARPVKKPLTPIDCLKLPTRVRSVLKNEGFQSIGDVIDKTEREMLEVRNFGKGRLAILKAYLAAHGETLRSPVK